ncbi:aldose epimerase family protein [Streptomyces peucetius]|uniref:Aldose 1-epimerase n=1 Tax=Streptomyces peucetius TaxID=1950 RepID=A0ABY6I0A9_STRPE|nr:aldose epimerase family protein [Streptomyces peucetius]UYQ60404.1 galactose mutarotase [Streptomyces peucetius]
MPRPSVHHRPFGTTPSGEEVGLWRLESGTGVHAEILTYGGVLHTLEVPDTTGAGASVVLSLGSLDQYAEKSPYLGALVGRYANRIALGRFTLDGTTYQVPANDRGHALHGGPGGFDTKVWQATQHVDATGASVRLALHSPHGDMGFPGALDITTTYRLDTAGTLILDHTAVTDRPTVVNVSNHAYFNLAGDGDVLGHTLEVDAPAYLPVAADGIPHGPAADVTGTAFDLRSPGLLAERVAAADEQIRQAGGYDHCWVLPGGGDGTLRRAARLTAPAAARVMEVWTTEPGVQVYTANQLDGTLMDGTGRCLERHGGVCLETQHFPDAPNRPAYPSTVLRPGAVLRSRTEFRFLHLAAGGRGA